MNAEDQSPCKVLEWDTDFFGIRVAKVFASSLNPELVRRIDNWCHRNQVKCLYFLACADDALTSRTAEDNGFRLVDVKITLKYENHASIADTDRYDRTDCYVRQACPADIPLLQEMTRNGYHHSRFYFDENFPRALCDSFYETWIKVSCEGYASTVLVAENNKLPVGFISCHLDSTSGSIGLVGVNKTFRGRGIGKILLDSALHWFLSRGVQDITVSTQGRNIVAQRFYQRFGFLTSTLELWYHKWY